MSLNVLESAKQTLLSESYVYKVKRSIYLVEMLQNKYLREMLLICLYVMSPEGSHCRDALYTCCC